MGPPGAPSLANHKRPRATTVLTHNLREQVLRRVGLVAAATIIIARTKNNGWLLDLSDEDLRTAVAAGGAYLAADTLTWRGVDIRILCIHRIHGPEDARIVAAGNPRRRMVSSVFPFGLSSDSRGADDARSRPRAGAYRARHGY